MLEPESRDSLLAWNFFPEILQRTEYIEGYAIAPLADRMLAENPALKAEFEAKLAADPKFAADPDARLGWFYERTPYYDERFLLYPGRQRAQALSGRTARPRRDRTATPSPAPLNSAPGSIRHWCAA